MAVATTESPRYFYYISRNKVDMLLPQLEPHWQRMARNMAASLSLAGVKVDVGKLNVSERDLVTRLLCLEKTLKKRKTLISLDSVSEPPFKVFLSDSDTWRHGLFYFQAHRLTFCSYLMVKVHRGSLIILIGSAANVLGSDVVVKGVQVPGTSGSFQNVLDFMREFCTDEPAAAGLNVPVPNYFLARYAKRRPGSDGVWESYVEKSFPFPPPTKPYKAWPENSLSFRDLGTAGERLGTPILRLLNRAN
jgi:hypothetical protein